MRPTSTLVALGLWCLSRTAHSYKIHEDCGDSTPFVKDMIEQAFNMAHLASAAVKTTPVDPDANFLGEQLFGMQNNELKILIESTIDGGTMPGLSSTIPGILAFENEQTGNLDSLAVNEVVVFCTTTRLKKSKESKEHMWDEVAQEALKIGNTDNCEGKTFMWTYALDDKWDEIQICPWFLRYAKLKKNKTIKDLTSMRAIVAVAGMDRYITRKHLTPIDLLSLWDKTMLHEFMHTKAAGRKDDVEGDGWGSYGWKNAKNIARDGRAVNNADNWALFGSALFWIQQGSPINEDGAFIAAGSGGGQSSGGQSSGGQSGGGQSGGGQSGGGQSGSGKRWLGSGAGNAWGQMKAEAVRRFT